MGIGSWGWLWVIGITAPAHAQEQVGARGFIAHTYVKKTVLRGFRFASPRLLTPELYDLVAHDGGHRLNYDPLCQCSNPDGLSAQIVSVSGSRQRTLANVVLRFDGSSRKEQVTIAVTHTAGGWKIADVGSARVPSLKAWLGRWP